MHHNSGVNNKAAYLIAHGDTFNGQTITGIGNIKTAQIYYQAETTLLGPASNYQDLGNALRQACSTLAGAGAAGITSANCAQVNKVVLATQMDTPPKNQPTSNPAPCNAGLKLAPTFTENFENQAEVNQNWRLTTPVGTAAWAYPTNPFGIYATSGTKSVWGYDQPTIADSSVVRVAPIKVPTQGAPRMRFAHSFGFETGLGAFADGGVVEISTDSGNTWNDASGLFVQNGYTGKIYTGAGNPLAGRSAFVGESGGYETSILNLAPVAGKNILVRFRLGTDSGGDDYGWFIDDFQVYSCKNAVPPDTKITKAPKRVKTNKKVAKVTFKFRGSDDVDSARALKFQCDFGDGDWQACRSPLKARAKARKGKGAKYTFKVRAVDSSGNPDPTPDKATFKVIKKSKKKGHKHHKHRHHRSAQVAADFS